MTTLKTAITDWIRLKVQGSSPETPADGYGYIYDKNGSFAYKNAAGTETILVTVAPTINDYILVRDEETANVPGGTFTKDVWQTRVINTEVVDTGSNCSLPGSNVIRLAAGIYRYAYRAPATQVGHHRARLYNVTAGSVLPDSYSQNIYGTDTQYHTLFATGWGQFTIAAQTDFRLEHRCGVTRANDGFGSNQNWDGIKEYYASVELWKIG